MIVFINKLCLNQVPDSLINNNIPYEQRLCILYCKYEIEDEYHFVRRCPVCQSLRLVLFLTIVDEHATVDTFCSLFKGNID